MVQNKDADLRETPKSIRMKSHRGKKVSKYLGQYFNVIFRISYMKETATQPF